MDSTANENITPRNIISKLRFHDESQVPAICLVAGQEIERLREERERYRSALLYLHYMAGAEVVTPSIAQAMRKLIEKALAEEEIAAMKQLFQGMNDESIREFCEEICPEDARHLLGDMILRLDYYVGRESSTQ